MVRFGTLSPKKILKEARSPPPPRDPSPMKEDGEVSPELVPIVTLISAQSHRRYYEGIFMLYYDLNGDGKPADREWREVYGILTGNQLAYWDAASLARFKDSPDQLLETSSKPNYLNFTDAVFNAMRVLPAAKQQLENVIIVSTTLKNRYIIQFRSYDLLKEWFLSLRLAAYEYQSLQEAYTGALLLARGLRLLDIRTILAEKRFNHEDWVLIRYGLGMAWTRCYAVVEPSMIRKKVLVPGRVLLYNLENTKKKNLTGIITNSTLVTAVYPQLHFFIDQSTIMKLEGSINFQLPSVKGKKNADVQETSLFIMPELHSAVPGFDTLIRFLIPLLDSFGLYGRPKRLKADRVDPESLLFGLPTLPHVHYLNLSDLYPLAEGDQYLSWDTAKWTENLKRVMKLKLAQGYDGCGSSRGFSGALSSLNSPRVASPATLRKPSSPIQLLNPSRAASGPLPALSEPMSRPTDSRVVLAAGNFGASSSPGLGLSVTSAELSPSKLKVPEPSTSSRNVHNLEIKPDVRNAHKLVQLADIYHKYSKIETPSDRFNDRNQLLNGSAEEIEEEHLPLLIRKKSLIHGPLYPTNDNQLFNDTDSGEDDESEDSSYGEPPLNTLLKANGNRNSSYSLVQSPTTQYNEFSQQFNKSVDANMLSHLYNNNSDDESGSDLSDEESAPLPPAHQKQDVRSAQPHQVPQIQLLSLLHSQQTHKAQPQTPSRAQPSYAPSGPSQAQGLQGVQQQQSPQKALQAQANARQNGVLVQKSKPSQNLNLELSSENKPRYISSPNSSQNHLPRFDQRSGPAAYLPVTSNTPPIAMSQLAPQQAQPVRSLPNPQQAPQHAYRAAVPQGQSVPANQPVYTQKPELPTVAPTSAYRVQPQQYQQYQPRPQQSQSRPTGSPQNSQHHIPQSRLQQTVQSRPPQASQQRPSGQQQSYPAQSSGQHKHPYYQQAAPTSQYQGSPQYQSAPVPYPQTNGYQQVATGFPAGYQQQAPLLRQPMNSAPPSHPQQPQSAQNIRSYGESGQNYQYQVQPNFTPRQEQSRTPNRPGEPQSGAYMRKY